MSVATDHSSRGWLSFLPFGGSKKVDAPPMLTEKPPTRDECLSKLSQYSTSDKPIDLMVVGGGSVGVATALDAVTRGLSVGLVEMGDYASETSSKSTKLIHGGIRYLQKAVFQLDYGQFILVADALKERTVMLHQAPHLCKPLPTLIPCYSPLDIFMYWSGTKLYDLIALVKGGTIKYSGFVWPYETMNAYPYLKKTDEDGHALLGAVRYYDGQLNDARLCYAAAATAGCYGAATVNYAKVTGMKVVENGKGEQVVETTVQDTIHNKNLTVYSRAVLNAGGPFSEQVERLNPDTKADFGVAPAAGTHIIVDRKYCPREREATVIPSSDGRVVFTIPWLGGCLLGTTDRPVPVSHNPKPTEEDIRFLLKNVKPYVGEIPREDVKSAWCGIRPLAINKENASKKGGTENLVREHMVTVQKEARMVSVTGGKWTTYRQIGEDAVDKLLSTVLADKKAQVRPCSTRSIVYTGARHLDSLPPRAPDIPEDIDRHWRNTYGDKYPEVAAIARANNGKLMKRLVDTAPVVEAEVVYSAQNEQCERAIDFVTRRTRMAFLDIAAAEKVVPRVADLMASAKSWSGKQKKAEVAEAYAVLSTFAP